MKEVVISSFQWGQVVWMVRLSFGWTTYASVSPGGGEYTDHGLVVAGNGAQVK